MYEFFNKHYALVDGESRILAIWSDGPNPDRDTAEAVCINEKGSYQVYLVIDGKRTEENPRWLDEYGIPLYKYEDGEVVKRTEEEIEADREALPKPEYTPTTDERVTTLEEQLAESDAVAMALYEASLEQETVNAEQDAAILGLYEMIGG